MNSNGPLAGLRVADFTWVGAGPFATKQFAEFGAEVIKVESTVRPDDIRSMHPFKDGIAGINRSGYFANRNPNKKSIVLNLRSEEGRRLALELIARSDVVANNFTSGVMDRLGLSYDRCKEVNPRVIYLSMPLMGNDGPDRDARGYGLMLGAMTGFIGMSGHPDGLPIGTGTNYPDHVPNPLHAAIAVMAALRHRDLHGEGQEIELSQFESTLNVLGGAILEASLTGHVPARQGNAEAGSAPHGVYRCAGDNQYCAIAVANDKQWAALLSVLKDDRLSADRWRTAEGRAADQATLDECIEECTSSLQAWVLASALCASGVPASAVADARDVTMHDAQLAHRKHWVTLSHPEMGLSIYDAAAAKLSRTPGGLQTAAPCLGEHTEEVVCGLLGVTKGEFTSLKERGIFA